RFDVRAVAEYGVRTWHQSQRLIGVAGFSEYTVLGELEIAKHLRRRAARTPLHARRVQPFGPFGERAALECRVENRDQSLAVLSYRPRVAEARVLKEAGLIECIAQRAEVTFDVQSHQEQPSIVCGAVRVHQR